MNRLPLALLFPALMLAQQSLITRGAEIFATTCANGYCHGPKGSAGSAPRLAARGLDAQYIRQAITEGRGEMPPFGNRLNAGEMAAVLAYVGNLNGISPQAFGLGRGAGPERTGQQSTRSLTPQAAKGRALFFDATRAFGRCSTCHQVDGNGLPITDPITRVPDNPAALRSLATTRVRTATVQGDSFPAIVVKNSASESIIYDLTSPPPVRRMFPGGGVRISEGSKWRHASVIQPYNDAELESILVFLRSVVQP